MRLHLQASQNGEQQVPCVQSALEVDTADHAHAGNPDVSAEGSSLLQPGETKATVLPGDVASPDSASDWEVSPAHHGENLPPNSAPAAAAAAASAASAAATSQLDAGRASATRAAIPSMNGLKSKDIPNGHVVGDAKGALHGQDGGILAPNGAAANAQLDAMGGGFAGAAIPSMNGLKSNDIPNGHAVEEANGAIHGQNGGILVPNAAATNSQLDATGGGAAGAAILSMNGLKSNDIPNGHVVGDANGALHGQDGSILGPSGEAANSQLDAMGGGVAAIPSMNGLKSNDIADGMKEEEDGAKSADQGLAIENGNHLQDSLPKRDAELQQGEGGQLLVAEPSNEDANADANAAGPEAGRQLFSRVCVCFVGDIGTLCLCEAAAEGLGPSAKKIQWIWALARMRIGLKRWKKHVTQALHARHRKDKRNKLVKKRGIEPKTIRNKTALEPKETEAVEPVPEAVELHAPSEQEDQVLEMTTREATEQG